MEQWLLNEHDHDHHETPGRYLSEAAHAPSLNVHAAFLAVP